MAKEVVKKDGTKEAFEPEKIRSSVMAAAATVDLSEERKKEVTDQVTAAAVQMMEAKEEITTSEIREKVLSDLDQIEPSISASWREYDKTKQ